MTYQSVEIFKGFQKIGIYIYMDKDSVKQSNNILLSDCENSAHGEYNEMKRLIFFY